MKVILDAKFYGYCPGLIRSFRIADNLIKQSHKDKKKIECDVPLAHNADVLSDLRKRGVELIEIDEATDGSNKHFLVSAHGASHNRIEWLKAKGYEITDATCPKVATVQTRATNDYRAGYQILIFGKADHAETLGINGMIDNTAIILREVESAAKLKLKSKTSVIAQTTFPPDKFDLGVKNLVAYNPEVDIIIRRTICPIVQSRIDSVIEYINSSKIDMTVVVGSPTSSNTKSLAYDVRKVCPVRMVADSKGLDADDFQKDQTILVVSGTSAPPEVVEKVADKIREFGNLLNIK